MREKNCEKMDLKRRLRLRDLYVAANAVTSIKLFDTFKTLKKLFCDSVSDKQEK